MQAERCRTQHGDAGRLRHRARTCTEEYTARSGQRNTRGRKYFGTDGGFSSGIYKRRAAADRGHRYTGAGRCTVDSHNRKNGFAGQGNAERAGVSSELRARVQAKVFNRDSHTILALERNRLRLPEPHAGDNDFAMALRAHHIG